MLNIYGLLISISILVCTLIAKSLIKKNEEDTLWGLVFWIIIFGVIGARIYHVIDYFDFYAANPIKILKVWNGGLGIWGAIFGGIVGAFIYLKKRQENTYRWLDIISVVLPLGQAIGRWGNLFNQEIFGKPSTLPWSMYIKAEDRPLSHTEFNNFHPLFLYESVLNFLLFFTLYLLYKKYSGKIPSGIFLSLYLGSYSIIRFFLEYLRINPWEIHITNNVSLNVSQCISILVLTLSIVFIKLRTNKK